MPRGPGVGRFESRQPQIAHSRRAAHQKRQVDDHLARYILRKRQLDPLRIARPDASASPPRPWPRWMTKPAGIAVRSAVE